jgi:hypothetical protein
MHRGLQVTVVTAILFLVFPGCAIVQAPTVEERSAIQTGKQVVVLLRLTGELSDGTQIETFRIDIRDADFSFALGGFETGGKLERTWPRFLSRDSAKEGWPTWSSNLETIT